jgi:hypothetical protein
MDGIAGVEARIAEIQSMFPATSASAATATSTATDTTGSDFSSALSDAQSVAETASTASTAAVSSGGGSREQWARDFLTALGLPVTSENVRAIAAWEKAEGTRAQYNPLATTQNMAGATRFNSVGVKNYVNYQDGIDANVKALTNGRYGNIIAALQAGNSAVAVAQAIANSPWGTGQGVLRVLQSQ